MTEEEVNAMILHLRDPSIMVPCIRTMMSYIRSDRQQYIGSHASEFLSDSSRRGYLKNWVANYEISDIIKLMRYDDVHFMRQIERGTVHNEEERRLIEEIPFRNGYFFMEQLPSSSSITATSAATTTAAVATATEAKQDASTLSSLLVSSRLSSLPLQKLTSSVDWIAHNATMLSSWRRSSLPSTSSTAKSDSLIFITDTAGHFVVCRPILLLPSRSPLLLVLNSSSAIIHTPLAQKLYRMCFHHLPDHDKYPVKS
jgi:hypothetical protein